MNTLSFLKPEHVAPIRAPRAADPDVPPVLAGRLDGLEVTASIEAAVGHLTRHPGVFPAGDAEGVENSSGVVDRTEEQLGTVDVLIRQGSAQP